MPLRRSDGVYRRIAFRSRRMQLPGERPFVLNHGMDVTEQHEAEEALHLATRQRELILESVGDGIYGIDLDGKLTFINEAGAQTLGYTPEQLTGRDVHELIHHSHADGTPYSQVDQPDSCRRCGAASRSACGTRFSGAGRDRDPRGVQRQSADGRRPHLGHGGGVPGRVRTAAAGKMKDEFISTVSHELRTPLTSLRASLGLIRRARWTSGRRSSGRWWRWRSATATG